MKYRPISHEKANESGNFDPLPEGEYDFTVQDAADTTSQSGNEMIKLTLRVMTPRGQARVVFDYLVAAENQQWKVRHFCECVGLIESYESGLLEAYEMIQKSGRVKLVIRPAKGEYPAGNQVRDYVVPEGAKATRQRTLPLGNQPAPATAPGGGDLDDDIPFGPCVQ